MATKTKSKKKRVTAAPKKTKAVTKSYNVGFDPAPGIADKAISFVWDHKWWFVTGVLVLALLFLRLHH